MYLQTNLKAPNSILAKKEGSFVSLTIFCKAVALKIQFNSAHGLARRQAGDTDLSADRQDRTD